MNFYEKFRNSLQHSGLSNTAFADSVNCSKQFVSDMIAGRRTPPLDRLDAWADALGLEGEVRAQFQRAAYLAHAPLQVGELVDHLEERIVKLEQALGEPLKELPTFQEIQATIGPVINEFSDHDRTDAEIAAWYLDQAVPAILRTRVEIGARWLPVADERQARILSEVDAALDESMAAWKPDPRQFTKRTLQLRAYDVIACLRPIETILRSALKEIQV